MLRSPEGIEPFLNHNGNVPRLKDYSLLATTVVVARCLGPVPLTRMTHCSPRRVDSLSSLPGHKISLSTDLCDPVLWAPEKMSSSYPIRQSGSFTLVSHDGGSLPFIPV